MAVAQEMRCLTESDVKRAYELESAGYPEDEGASLDTITYRQKEAPLLSYGYFEEDKLIGFINATRYICSRFDEKSMTEHQPNASTVCIHSVCVDEDKRRQGIALRLLRNYTEHVKNSQPGVLRLLLLCKSALIPLYTKAGYTLVGKSSVAHGKDTWYEMEQNI